MTEHRCPWCMAEIDGPGPCPSCGHVPAEYVAGLHHLPVGSVLNDRYLVGRALGEGGFGITYVGFDQVLYRRVAIKEYFPVGYATRFSSASIMVTSTVGPTDESYTRGREKFLSEAQAMARVGGREALVGVTDFFQSNGTAYIIMEYVEGKSLSDICAERGGKIPFQELMELLDPIFGALNALHEAGLVHRDISPDNIMIGNGSARLIDFGCAREFLGGEGDSRTMTVMLKYDYAAPEQYGREGQGPWTDVYGMCATMYRCLVGEVPPRAMSRLSGEELVPPSSRGVEIPKPAEETLIAGLEIKPELRPQSMVELAKGLTATPRIDRQTVLLRVAIALVALSIAVVGGYFAFGRGAADAAGAGQGLAADGGTTSSNGGSSTAGVEIEEPAEVTFEPWEIQEGQIQALTDAKKVSAGAYHTLALREDGTVGATAAPTKKVEDVANVEEANNFGQCDVSSWTDVVEVSAGGYHSLGRKRDGSVLAAGMNDFGECDVKDWNVMEVAAGLYHSVGLKQDGTVVAAGADGLGQCDVGEWHDIVQIAAGDGHTVGLRADGTVVAVGWNEYGQCNVKDWTDIVQVSAGMVHTVGLRADGTVVATRFPKGKGENDFGQCNVKDWQDVVYVSAGWRHTVGVRADGSVVTAGQGDGGRCNVSGWPEVKVASAGGYHTVGLTQDGNLKAVGKNDDHQCSVSKLLQKQK